MSQLSFKGGYLYGTVFDKNFALKEFSFSEDTKLKDFEISEKYKYIYKKDNNFFITTFKPNVEDYICLNKLNDLNIEILISLWEERGKLLKEVQNKNISRLYNMLFKELKEEEFNKFWHEKNIKFFKQLEFPEDFDLGFEPFCRFYYNLGGFTLPQKEEHLSKSGKKVVKCVDYAQRLGEFVKEELKKENNIFIRSNEFFGKMKLGKFNNKFTKFFLQKEVFNQMCEEVKFDKNFIKKSYEKFDEVQRANTSHKGNQRQLQPTVSKFKNYFIKNKFEGITLANYAIARTISPFYYSQTSFDKALEIDKERIEKGTKNNILENHLEEKDVLSQIEELSKLIKSKGVSSVHLLSDLLKNNFSFEWLEKNDPKNFVLGKYCSCCAHLEASGYTYMHASIVDPDVQNLVIKNKDGEIIAKSTLYVNREEGYGIFNNIEIYSEVEMEAREEIFRKFQLATVSFVQEYNKEHPDKPIHKVNVGMDYNKLREKISVELKKEKNLLKSINYEEFGDDNFFGGACSDNEQYIVWEDKNN